MLKLIALGGLLIEKHSKKIAVGLVVSMLLNCYCLVRLVGGSSKRSAEDAVSNAAITRVYQSQAKQLNDELQSINEGLLELAGDLHDSTGELGKAVIKYAERIKQLETGDDDHSVGDSCSTRR